MPAKRPESDRKPAKSIYDRFPLAARAMHVSVDLQGNDLQGNDLPGNPTSNRSAGGHIKPAAPVLAGKRRHGNWALYLFLFLLPLQNIQTGYLPNLGGGLNFLNVMFALSLLGAWFAGGRIARHEPVNHWVLIYAVYSLFSLWIGYQYVSDTETHFNMLKDHLLGVFVVYLVQMSVNNWTDVRRIVIATLLPLPYIAKVTWIEHQGVSSWHYSDDLRIQGTFALLGANEFAAFCVTVAVVLFAILIAARVSRLWRIALLMGIACMVLGVLYAYSRTAYISLLLGIVAVVLAWRGRWKLALPLLLAVVIIPPLLPPSVVERYDSSNVEEGERDESTEMRFVYWQVAWENFLSHPVVGTGFQSFHHPEINPYKKDTHNLYIRTLTEGGLIGAVVLLGLLLSIFRTAHREISHAAAGTWRYALALGVLGAWISLLCGNLFGDRFTYFPMIAYFWAYVALVVKARHLPAENPLR